MLKKLILAGFVAVVVLAGLRGTSFLGYAKQEVAEARVWLDDQVPVEKKIEQMRTEVANLDRDIEHVKNNLATEIVDVRALTTDVAQPPGLGQHRATRPWSSGAMKSRRPPSTSRPGGS